MTVRKSYNRFFIIFQEEDKGYALAIDKQPTGYAKIENRNGRCKITVYAQNLKKEKGPYHFYVIDTVKTPAHVVKIGEVKIDEIGRGETCFEYNEENIAESNCPIEKFNVAVIIAKGSAGEMIAAPLSGYTGKEKVIWKDKVFVEEKHEDKHEHEHEEPGIVNEIIERVQEEILDEEGMKFREYEENIRSQVEDSLEEENSLPEAANEAVRSEKAEESNNKPLIENRQDSSELTEEYDAGYINNEMPRHEEHKHKGRKTYAAIFHHILNNFEEIEDVFEEPAAAVINCRWWKIPHSCNIPYMEEKFYPFLCTIFHLKMTYPDIDYIKYYRPKGHYYFGIKYDGNNEVKYLMYGIEGSNILKEQPYMGMTGFGKWMKLKGKNRGMWIMFYNPRTGNVMLEKKER